MDRLKLKAVLGGHPHVQAVKSGELRSDLFDLDFITYTPTNTAFKPMVREQAFDVCEMAIVTYLMAKAHGKPLVLLPAASVIEHPWTLHPTPQALAAVVTMGIFSSAIGLMLFYMCLARLGTLTTNAQGYLRIPIGVGLSVVLVGEAVPSNLALGLVLVMAGVAAMTVPGDRYKLALNWLRARLRS
jgi:uncharacterized protein YjeT (DUF2065 family)